MIFWKESCTRERYSEYVAEAPRVHKKPVTYFPLETSLVFSVPALIARREADVVRRTRELSMKGVNFCELRE